MIDKENLIQFLKEKKLEDYSDEILKQLNETVKKALNDKLKEIKNKKRIISNDNNKEHFSANEIFTKEEIERFPTWVKNNITDAKVDGN